MPDKEYLNIEDVNTIGKTILVRIDVNSPIDPSSKRILDDNRFRSHKQTFNKLRNSKIAVIAHQSRPGRKDFTTTEQHTKKLSEILQRPVEYVDDIFGTRARQKIQQMEKGDIIFLENVRFYSEEVLQRDPQTQGETILVNKLTPYFDYYIMDAFAAAHRSQPSIVGFPQKIPAISGCLMEKEIQTLEKIKKEFKNTYFVLGGVKIKDSIKVINHLLENKTAEKIYVTGVVANTFIKASGHKIGKPNTDFIKEIADTKQIEKAKKILKKHKNKIEIPKDVAIEENGQRKDIPITKIPQNKMIQDIGIETIADFTEQFKNCQAIVMNGPAGVFEKENFAIGTKELVRTASELNAYTLIGGGHICTAAEDTCPRKAFDHISTGGGALMQFFTNKKLPALQALKTSRKKFMTKQ
ncbi:3-phosphoglycerate kinase Pgk [Methanonatronarchaeum thermophilum]|uniref:Phosphoglycerate kinase n=1 Tax=Methanonatronarchaeum thermophilum TaxID=1927129 RepID=A0A1Y3GFM7_9EURY|nr:phosphoglycerate kinase [Methanonatronarchaeum thermophilum]OUJ18255.1 3-phosphoglycerate kinase Pgk [Methanonatronarchaeum thermophilum]